MDIVLTVLLSNGCSMTMAASPSGILEGILHVLPSSGDTYNAPFTTSW